jgi:hypothetical protein
MLVNRRGTTLERNARESCFGAHLPVAGRSRRSSSVIDGGLGRAGTNTTEP